MSGGLMELSYVVAAVIIVVIAVVVTLQIRNVLARRKMRQMEAAVRARIRLYNAALIDLSPADRRWVMETYIDKVVTWGKQREINWRIYVNQLEGFKHSMIRIVLIGQYGVSVQQSLYDRTSTSIDSLGFYDLIEVEQIILSVFRPILLPQVKDSVADS